MTKKRRSDRIYSPPSQPVETSAPPVLEDLITFLWSRLNALQREADAAEYDKHKAQLYLAMAAHARILADLLKDSGLSRGEKEDLAKMLSKIRRKATVKARRIIWGESRRRKRLKS